MSLVMHASDQHNEHFNQVDEILCYSWRKYAVYAGGGSYSS